MLAALEDEENEGERELFIRKLTIEGRRRRHRKIPRCALIPPFKMTPWQKLYSSGDDQSLNTVTGFDHKVFRELLVIYEPWFLGCSPYTKTGAIRVLKHPYSIAGKRGRPRQIDATISLAIVLTWTRTRGATWMLCAFFGLTGSPLDLRLKFGVLILAHALKTKEHAKVRHPTNEVVDLFAAIVAEKYPNLGKEKVYSMMDGLKLRLEQAGDPVRQNRFYNGWTHDHYVNHRSQWHHLHVRLKCSRNPLRFEVCRLGLRIRQTRSDP